MARGEKASPIGGEIYSPTLDGVVVSAEGIKDYIQNKFQEDINAEVISNLESHQAQIDAIVSDKTTVALTVTPAAVFADGTDKTVMFIATSTPTKATIVFDGGQPVENTRAEFPLVVNSGTPVSITKTASFTVAGINKGTKSATVKLVYPIYYGAGMSYETVNFIQYPDATVTPARTYIITIPEGGGYIFFKIPKEQVSQISRVVLDEENPSPIDGSIVSSDSNHNIWRSNVQYDQGTYRFKVTA